MVEITLGNVSALSARDGEAALSQLFFDPGQLNIFSSKPESWRGVGTSLRVIFRR